VAIVFDTLEYASRLNGTGFTDQQAEAQVQALAAIVNDNLATKQDVVLVKQDILALRQELKHDLRELEHRLTLHLGTVVSVAVGVVAALVKLL
jgi:hypothetical protein